MKDLLRRVNISGFDTDAYMNKHQQDASALPTIGIAMSGGGYRAMLNGAGVIQAFDNRSANSTSPGHLGGLLQAATYLSGLSGGSWLVSTLYANNNTSVDRIISSAADSGNLWQLDNTILQGPDSGGVQLFDSGGYYNALLDQVSRKEDAGFNTTLTDYWGRALSYQVGIPYLAHPAPLTSLIFLVDQCYRRRSRIHFLLHCPTGLVSAG